MAELKNKYFGEIKGKFGDVVFKVRNGKNFAAQRPRNYTAPQTPEYKKRIESFSLSTKFASAIIRTDELKNIWIPEAPKKGTVFQYIISKSYNNLVSEDNISELNITPGKGFNVDLESVLKNENAVTVTVKELGENTGIDINNETKVRLLSMFMTYNPKTEGKPEYDLFIIKSGIKNLVLDEQLIFNLNLSNSHQNIISHYNVLRLYCSLITFTDDLIQINYSDTMFNNIIPD